MENLNKTLVEISKNGDVTFLVTENETFLNTPISELELDTRSQNALYRFGVCTVKDILENLTEIPKIRGCGTKSFNRILYKICVYNYARMTPEEKVYYLKRLREFNN
jgi:DNA-directed RNA polymerase alpha subunit